MITLDDTCVSRHKQIGESICKALHDEAIVLGFAESTLPKIDWQGLSFSVSRDPASGSDCLACEWKNNAGYRIGQIQFNEDGSFFAEHDIALSHPSDKSWFVEAVEAWGRDNQITTEVRLLAAV